MQSSHIAFSGLSDSERDIAFSTVRHMPRFTKVVKVVDEQTTHVVSAGARTLKVIAAAARGLWLVSPDWVLQSLEAREWLDEAPFELAQQYPGAQQNRVARAKHHGRFRSALLKDTVCFVADGCEAPKRDIESLIIQCGGTVGVTVAAVWCSCAAGAAERGRRRHGDQQQRCGQGQGRRQRDMALRQHLPEQAAPAHIVTAVRAVSSQTQTKRDYGGTLARNARASSASTLRGTALQRVSAAHTAVRTHRLRSAVERVEAVLHGCQRVEDLRAWAAVRTRAKHTSCAASSDCSSWAHSGPSGDGWRASNRTLAFHSISYCCTNSAPCGADARLPRQHTRHELRQRAQRHGQRLADVLVVGRRGGLDGVAQLLQPGLALANLADQLPLQLVKRRRHSAASMSTHWRRHAANPLAGTACWMSGANNVHAAENTWSSRCPATARSSAWCLASSAPTLHALNSAQPPPDDSPRQPRDLHQVNQRIEEGQLLRGRRRAHDHVEAGVVAQPQRLGEVQQLCRPAFKYQ